MEIDLLILNNCPSFYKVNLYNELSKKCSVYVIFLGYSDQVVIKEDFKDEIKFPYLVINNNSLEKRSFIKSFYKIYSFVLNNRVKKIVYGGYNHLEFIFLSFLFPYSKNIIQSESSIYESKITGLKGFLKERY